MHFLSNCCLLLLLLSVSLYGRPATADDSTGFLPPFTVQREHASEGTAEQNALFASARKEFLNENYGRALELFHDFLLKSPHSSLIPEATQYYTISRAMVSEPASGQSSQQLNKSEAGEPATGPAGPAIEEHFSISGGAPLQLDFKGYLTSVLKSDPGYQAEGTEFKRLYAQSMANLQGYSWQLSFDPSALLYDDQGATYGADFTVNLSRTLYDGGRKRLLEGEMDIVSQLSRTGLIDSRNRVALLAANTYVTFYSLQQEVDLLSKNLDRFQKFMQSVEQSYRKGLRFSSYEYYSAKSQSLVLERELLQKRADLLKAETDFRLYGNITSSVHLELSPLSAPSPRSLQSLETEALAANSTIQEMRLQRDLQQLRVEERAAQSGPSVQLKSSVGMQTGSGNYTGTSTTYGYGTKALASVGVFASIPLWDGGVRKSTLQVEEMEALKQKLLLKKATDDVIRRLSQVYIDYLSLEKNREITAQLAELNRKRFQIASERFDRGLEPYRSVQEALSDSTLSEIELIRQEILLQKLRLDMALLSGVKAAEL